MWRAIIHLTNVVTSDTGRSEQALGLPSCNPSSGSRYPKVHEAISDSSSEDNPPLTRIEPYRWLKDPKRDIDALRMRKAFVTTDTELKLMAAAAIMGLKSRPKKG